MAEVKLNGLVKRLGDITALNNITFDIKDEEFVTLLGPTGAGKTTTLRCVVGLEKLDEGDVFVDGVSFVGLPPGRRNMAFVSQHYALYPHMTVFQNMKFPLDKTMLSKEEKKARIDKIAELLHIDQLLKRYPSKLSGGEMQRVVIGRAMVREPNIFLLDEPLSNLDAKLREELRFELKRLQKEAGSTTLYVTHDQVEAMSMADRVIVLHKGVIQQVGTPTEIYSNPANILVSSIIGSPSMNLVPITVDDGCIRVASGGYTIDIPQNLKHKLPAGNYKLGVRPEDVLIVTENTPNSLPAEAYLIEAQGYEKLVDITLGDFLLRARVSPRLALKTGDKIYIAFDEEKIRFFNKDGNLQAV
jgi:multiple sugar transport system ATP-binding protein